MHQDLDGIDDVAEPLAVEIVDGAAAFDDHLADFGGRSEHLDDAGACNIYFARGELFEYREHQLLLAHGARILDIDLFGKAQ